MQQTLAGLFSKIENLELKFDNFAAHINVKLDKILSKHCGDSDPAQVEDEAPDLFPELSFPLKTVEEVELLNQKLLTSEFKSLLISRLSRIGGKSRTADGGKLIYKLIDHLFEPELLVNFSWTGSSKSSESKETFQKYVEIVELLFEVIYIADSRHSKTRNEEFLKDKILKHTSQRLERKRKRKQNNGGSKNKNK